MEVEPCWKGVLPTKHALGSPQLFSGRPHKVDVKRGEITKCSAAIPAQMACCIGISKEAICSVEGCRILAPSGVSQPAERGSAVGRRDPDHPSRALPTAFHPTRLLYSATGVTKQHVSSEAAAVSRRQVCRLMAGNTLAALAIPRRSLGGRGRHLWLPDGAPRAAFPP